MNRNVNMELQEKINYFRDKLGNAYKGLEHSSDPGIQHLGNNILKTLLHDYLNLFYNDVDVRKMDNHTKELGRFLDLEL